MTAVRRLAIYRTMCYAGLGVIVLTGCSAQYGESVGPVRPVLSMDHGEDQLSLTDPYQRGKACLFLGQYGLAVSAFEEAVKKNPHSVAALNALAATYDRLQRFDLADRYYQEALALAPDSAQTLNNIGYSYFLRGDSRHALAYLKKAKEASGGDKTILGNLALVQRPAGTATAQKSDKPAESPSRTGSAAEQAHPAMRIERATLHMQDLITKPVAEDQGATRPTAQVTAELGANRPSPSAGTQTLTETQPLAANRGEVPATIDATPSGASAGTSDTKAEVAGSPLGAEHNARQTLGDRRSLVAPVSLWHQFAMKVEQIAGGKDRTPGPEVQHSKRLGAELRQNRMAEVAATPADSSPMFSQVRARFDQAVKAVVVALHGKAAPAPNFDRPRGPAHAISVLASFERPVAAQPRMPAFGHIFRDTVIEVSNGTGRSRMAARMRDFLRSKNIPVARLTDDGSFSQSRTVLSYREGFKDQAERLAGTLPQPVELKSADRQAADLRLLLGLDYLGFDRALLLVSSPLPDGSAI